MFDLTIETWKGLQAIGHKELSDHLSTLVETVFIILIIINSICLFFADSDSVFRIKTLVDLAQSKCLSVDDDSGDVAPLNLGFDVFCFCFLFFKLTSHSPPAWLRHTITSSTRRSSCSRCPSRRTRSCAACCKSSPKRANTTTCLSVFVLSFVRSWFDYWICLLFCFF